jgi:glycolate oxidase FAD binding subunit
VNTAIDDLQAVADLTVAPGTGADAVEGLTPRHVAQPRTPAAVAGALAWASARRHAVQLRGGGSKIGWGRPASALDLVIDLSRLDRVIAHTAGDLTATIEAGARLRDVNAALARHGQWLPVDPLYPERATIGGLLAANDSGPLRHRYGTPRDLVIGAAFVTGDGVEARAGGQVVKNVAGYDIARLAAGSHGGLVALTSATFKLSPLPEETRTLRQQVTRRTLGPFLKALMNSQLEPMAVDIDCEVPLPADLDAPATDLLVRYHLPASASDVQISTTAALLVAEGAQRPVVLTGEPERDRWAAQTSFAAGAGLLLRLSWLPAAIADVIETLARLRAEFGCTARLMARAAVGAGWLHVDGRADSGASLVLALRRSSTFHNVVVLQADPDVKAQVDVWNIPADRTRLLAALKRALDPANILSPGRGPS